MPIDLEAVIEYQSVPTAQLWDMLVATHPSLIQPDLECDDTQLISQHHGSHRR